MIEIILAFFLGMFAGAALVLAWFHYWDTHGEKADES